MGSGIPSPTPWTRRKAIALAALPPGIFLSGIGLDGAAADPAGILTISRKRLLNDTEHARTLLAAENKLNAELQRRIDLVKADLNAEEKELTRLRPTLERKIFDARVAAFDRKIRTQRREAQRQASALQNAFSAQRRKLVEALGPLLEAVRREYGASVILNSDQVLTSDPALDITDEVIARFNGEVPPPAIPDLDVLAPASDLIPFDGGDSDNEAGGG